MKSYGPAAQEGSSNLGAREYVQACLDLANWRTGDDSQTLLHAYGLVLFAKDGAGRDMQRIAGKFTNFENQFAMADHVLDKGKRLRSRLDDFLKNANSSHAKFRAIADAALEAVKIDTTLQLGANGTLEYRHSFHPGHDDGPEGLLLAFLLSKKPSIAGDLRTCRHCDRYFLVPVDRRGGPKPKYCPGTDHQELHDNLSRTSRRSRKSASAKGKHK